MLKWKLPPKEKIYEAFSVLADKRYELKDDGRASVTSSAGDKHYTVSWKETDGHMHISSNDNASRWQGYTGYPIIAILMIINTITYDKEIISHFKGIPWNDLNKAHKSNYSEVVNLILENINNPTETEKIRNEVNKIYDQIESLNLIR